MNQRWWIVIAGFFYDLTKSYAIPFTFFAFVSLLSTLCMFMAKPPAKRETTVKEGI